MYTSIIQVNEQLNEATRPDWIAIDHVQLAMPVGGEAIARQFYADVLGFVEMPKPPVMVARGGCWFQAGAVKLHLGAEVEFIAARKAHPALVLHGLREFIATHGISAIWNDEIVGTVRCHIDDPFGNRIELIEG